MQRTLSLRARRCSRNYNQMKRVRCIPNRNTSSTVSGGCEGRRRNAWLVH